MPRRQRQRQQPTIAAITQFFADNGFHEGQYIDRLKLRNDGYKVTNDEGEVIRRDPFKKFKRTNPEKGNEFGFDFNAMARIGGRKCWFQVACFGTEVNEWFESNYWLDELENEYIEQEVPSVGDIITVSGKFELREMDLRKGKTVGPQLVVWHPEDIRVQPKTKRPVRPDILAKKKATNKANKRKNAKEVVKNKARTGKSVKTAQGLNAEDVF